MHMVCVCVEYSRRSNRIPSSHSMEDQCLESVSKSYIKHLVSANTMFSYMDHWILLGIFWWPRASTRIIPALVVKAVGLIFKKFEEQKEKTNRLEGRRGDLFLMQSLY
ncbi:hypothetical protein HA466_0253180 [Hirschfeldia incana]|nr:hypothetical protein HA466_0253180 [Hirschfeldia incana]